MLYSDQVRFYWYILLIIVFVNALLLFTSIGEYTRKLATEFVHDPILIVFSLSFFIVLVTILGFAIGRTHK